MSIFSEVVSLMGQWGLCWGAFLLMRSCICASNDTVILQVMSSIRDCFVTGKWEDDKDAAKLLEEDGMCNTSKNGSYIQNF